MYRDRTTRCYLGFGIQMYSDGNLAQLNARQKRFTPWIDVTMWQCASKYIKMYTSTEFDPVQVEHITRGASLSHPSLPAWPCGKYMEIWSLDESGWVWTSTLIKNRNFAMARNHPTYGECMGIHTETIVRSLFFLKMFFWCFMRLARAMRRSGCKTMLWTSS